MITATTESIVITMTPVELESFIRRTVREELSQLFHTAPRLPKEALREAMDDDYAEDEVLLAEAIAVLEKYGNRPEAWTRWEDVVTELKTAEEAGELPD